ncbi:MAG: [LysW]-lysine hydrolase [Phycisphaerales bacterium]|nr:MAG: [LysW]-lysine hydrolase [Phycisphaerales bacterium]
MRVLYELVATPSVSGSERAAAEVFVRHAARLGMRAEVDEAGNALAHRGPVDAETHVVLLGHIDTVPGEIAVRIEDDVLHGRGSVDAKGPLAAMLLAGARAELPCGVRVTVAGAVGEETAGSPGARHLAKLYRPAACIIGEPSGWDGVTLGYKGRLLVTASATRQSTHSAGPEPTACDDMHAWWSAVRAHAEMFNKGRDRVFDQLQASIRQTISEADGLRQHAKMHVGFRLPRELTPVELMQAVRSLTPEHVTLDFSGEETAFATNRNDAVARALSSAIRAHNGRPRPKLKTGTSDMNVVAPHWRCPIAAYGPGDSALDHTPHERLDLDEFARATRVLECTISQLASELTAAAPAHAAR